MNPSDILERVWAFVSDLWGQVVSLVVGWLDRNSYDTTLSDINSFLVILIVVATVIVCSYGPVYRAVLGYAVTFIHELGHALAGLTMGHRVRGLRINKDLSGETFTEGRGLISSIWITWWGYPFPALIGNIFIVTTYMGWTRIAFIILMVSLLGTFVISRGLTTIVVVVMGWAATWLLLEHAPPIIVNLIGLMLGLVLIMGAVRMILTVLSVHITREGVEQSDAYNLGRVTLIPGMFWVITMMAFIGWMAWASFSRLYLSIF